MTSHNVVSIWTCLRRKSENFETRSGIEMKVGMLHSASRRRRSRSMTRTPRRGHDSRRSLWNVEGRSVSAVSMCGTGPPYRAGNTN